MSENTFIIIGTVLASILVVSYIAEGIHAVLGVMP